MKSGGHFQPAVAPSSLALPHTLVQLGPAALPEAQRWMAAPARRSAWQCGGVLGHLILRASCMGRARKAEASLHKLPQAALRVV